MSRFLLALMLVLNVASLAQVQTLAADVSPGTVKGKTYQLVDEAQRVGRNPQPVARSQDRIIYLNRTPGDYTHVSEAPAGATVAASPTPTTPTPQQAVANAKPGIDAGWMKCPCDGECKCLVEDICKNGDCKKNYVIQITATWCRACPRMKVVADQLSKDGYIVYVVDFDTVRAKMDAMRITHVPATLVFNEGKEVKRFVGVASIDDIRDGLKKKSDQPDKKPGPQNPYDFK